MKEVKDKQEAPAPQSEAELAEEIVSKAPQDAQSETDTQQDAAQDVTMTAAEFEQVREHIKKLQTEKDETVALAQRLQADFENYRKRNAKLHLESVNEGERNVIKALLPVLDNFDRAMENCEGVDDQWLSGIKLVQRQLLDTLAKLGLSEIETDGMFDPTQHEAVMQQEVENTPSGSIVQVMQKGYKVQDRIVRHSMVSVAK